MAHITDFPKRERAPSTNLNFDVLIYMAWCDFRGSSIKFTTPEGVIEMIDVAATCRVLFLNTFGHNWQDLVADCWVVHCMNLAICQDEPHTHIRDTFRSCNTYAFIFTDRVIWYHTARPKQGGTLNKGCTTPCKLSAAKTKPWEVGIFAASSNHWPIVWGSLRSIMLLMEPGKHIIWRFTTLCPRLRSFI